MTTNSSTNPDSAIRQLQQVLGPTARLVRCASASLQQVSGVMRLSPAALGECSALDLAEAKAVALATGKVSGNLCALCGPAPALRTFVAANPAMVDAILVEQSGHAAWVFRVDGPMPPSVHGDGLTWLADGAALPVYERGGWRAFRPGMPLAALKPLRLDTIDWRPLGEFGLALLRDTLREQHGGIFSGSVAKKGRLNLPFWAAYLARILPVRFCGERRQFQVRDGAQGIWASLSLALLEKLIGDAVRSIPTVDGRAYVPRGFEVKDLVRQLRLLLCEDVDDPMRFLRHTLQMMIVPVVKGSVRSNSIIAVLKRIHRARGVAFPSQRRACREVKRFMTEAFGISVSHDIQRGEMSRRGYRGVKLRSNWRTLSTKIGTDGSDASPA